MITKTTKQIIVDELNFDGDKGLSSVEFCKSVDECKSLQKVWVGLDELKKEIEKLTRMFKEQTMEDYENGIQIINKWFNDLCNSQEQNTERTSEDVVSSAEGEKSPSVIIPKKCTCIQPMVDYHDKQLYCGRCGGEL